MTKERELEESRKVVHGLFGTVVKECHGKERKTGICALLIFNVTLYDFDIYK